MSRAPGDATSEALAGKVAVVTGASRGIGLAIVERFVAAGARVFGCARDGERLRAAMDGVRARARGAQIGEIRCDVARADDVAHMAAAVLERFGAPDVLVNNAGVVVRKTLDQTSEGDWDLVLGANLKGTYLVTRALAAAMRPRGGRIINIASITGRTGTAGLTAYAAAKHGVVGFTRALALELRGDAIAVNALCPGSVDTEMLAGSGFPPLMQPDDVAGVALYLAGAAPLQLTGSCVDVFG